MQLSPGRRRCRRAGRRRGARRPRRQARAGRWRRARRRRPPRRRPSTRPPGGPSSAAAPSVPPPTAAPTPAAAPAPAPARRRAGPSDTARAAAAQRDAAEHCAGTAPAPVAATPAGDAGRSGSTVVRPSLRGLAKALYPASSSCRPRTTGSCCRRPNAAHQASCEDHTDAVAQAWQRGHRSHRHDRLGQRIDAAPPTRAGARRRPTGRHDRRRRARSTRRLAAIDECADVITGPMSVLERVAEAFPGRPTPPSSRST